MIVAKVNFNVRGKDSRVHNNYYYNTDIEDLQKGDIVKVNFKNEDVLATFIQYVKQPKFNPKKSVLYKVSQEEREKYFESTKYHLIKNPLQVSLRALEYYRKNFKGNEECSLNTARLKLTRNVIISNNFNNPYIENKIHCFYYGSMKIGVRGNTIVYLSKLPKNKYIQTDINFKQQIEDMIMDNLRE